MTTRPKLESYRKGDLVQYFNNVLEIVTEDRAATLNITDQRKTLADVMERFNTSWQPSKGSELTPQIQQLDDERDSLFLGLKKTVDAWAVHHYDAEKKNAAFLIADKIGAHGALLHKLRYQQETATLNALILDFTNELADKVALLGLTQWVEKLQAVNTTFNEKYLERAKALSAEQDGVVLQLRSESTQAFQQLINIFEARMAIAKIEGGNFNAYETVNNELNEITEQYNEAIQKHNSAPKGGENPN